MNNLELKDALKPLLGQVTKPAKYIGGELHSLVKEEWKCHFGFAFPDTYEIGMSFMGLQILYSILNDQEDIYCERVFAPSEDMEALMRENKVPLYTLETKTPLRSLDILGFTLQYEMTYTNILNMLDLSSIPFLAKDRGNEHPILLAGGPCAFNPEPLADIFDIILVGDGEEAIIELCKIYIDCDKGDFDFKKEEFLQRASKIQGIYVPAFYEPQYNDDQTIKAIKKTWDGAPDRIVKAIVEDLDKAAFPENPIVPLTETIHDRVVIETFRGCTRGCRFCQAGMVYRPVRERSPETIKDLASNQLAATGHGELSLLSLSTSDYSQFEPMVMDVLQVCNDQDVSLSLPSLRLDTFSFKVLQEIQKYKKSGLTFAPEAGSQRLRDVVNKGITEEDILSAITQALALGWTNIKLYFMIGLPTETMEDLDGIIDLAQKITQINRDVRGRNSGRFNLSISVANFVPKPFTPFQWFPQDRKEVIIEKHDYLKSGLKIKNVSFSYHSTETSAVEAVFARGDRRLVSTLIAAHKEGAKMDGWSEHFKYDIWERAFETSNIDPDFYANRDRPLDEVFPWDIIHCGVDKEFLLLEWERALKGQVTADCRVTCEGCGIKEFTSCEMEGING